MTTWRKEIEEKMIENNEAWRDVEFYRANGSLDEEFDGGYGGEEGCHFVLWTKNFVYFPLCYDGSEWAGCAPRHPNQDHQPLRHQGG